MTLYVHASNAAPAAAPSTLASSWDRYNSAGPLAGARGYDPSWQSVGAAEGNPASPYHQEQSGAYGAASCAMGSQAWGGCYSGAYAGYAGGYCGGYGGYGGYSVAYGSQSAGGYAQQDSYMGAQSAYILNMDQYSDASDSEDEAGPQEKLASKVVPKPMATEAVVKDAKKPAEERHEIVAEVAEPAPEPTLEGSCGHSPSPPSTPASTSPRSSPLLSSPASPAASLLGSEVCGSASEPASEHEASSASEPEAESRAQDQDHSPAGGNARTETLASNERRPWRRTEPSVGRSQLKVSADSWAARQRARRSSADGNNQEDAEVLRNMKSILNKLTVEKFPVLYQKLLSSGIQTAGHAEGLIREVFEKATTQHHFVGMYADLCALLQEHFEQHPVSDDSKFSFRRLLLNECQASFERNLKPPAGLEELDEEERTLAEFRYKTRMIGNIRFVGALFARKMLASKVMFAIIEELLAHTTPEALESLAVLLTVVGPTFDRPEWAYHSLLCAVFEQIRTISGKASCNARAKCLLRDLLDLRARGWQDTRPKRCEGPTTLQDVARQAAAEERASAGRGGLRCRMR